MRLLFFFKTLEAFNIGSFIADETYPYHADEVYITNEASPYVIFHSGLDTDEIRKEVTSDLNKVNLTEGVDFYVEIN